MAIDDIPVFTEARRGQVVRSSDWNRIQQQLRNSIRTHQHTRPADQPVDDTVEEDTARQISTAELADGAVTGEKIADDTVRLRDLHPEVRDAIAGDPGGARVATDVVGLRARARERVEHQLGPVPVAVVLGIREEGFADLNGTFDIYEHPERPVSAVVPVDPDGTFVLASFTDRDLEVRWWAFARPEQA